MELISQHAKAIMEGCKERARDCGLCFQDETLEYIVTNRDMIELSPKNMIPTLYDFWVHDVEVLKEKGRYELYPNNPYETVINTRPPISFYNDNNPDWLNVMIFYHVIGHIDFFQNNLFFRHTWDYDFSARALSDKRMMARLRSEKGRWVDYVIEFARSIDNLVGYHAELARSNREEQTASDGRIDFYFDVFLQEHQKVVQAEYVREIERYNSALRESDTTADRIFLDTVQARYAEFQSLYERWNEGKRERHDRDIFQYLLEHSVFLSRPENRWMRMILEAVRTTSLYFQPQIRTKIMNEGWASYWHELLFMQDERICGHEIDFSIVNAKVTAMPRVGLNPYALGLRLFRHIEEMEDAGRFSLTYQRLKDRQQRDAFAEKTGAGRERIFEVRRTFSDSMFVNSFVDQDFVDKNQLFVAGKRLNKERMAWQYYVKSRAAGQYRDMVLEGLYHPPFLGIGVDGSGCLMLDHRFEGRPLAKDYISGTLLGLEYLWGGPVCLDTSEAQVTAPVEDDEPTEEGHSEVSWRRVRYRMQERKLSRRELA